MVEYSEVERMVKLILHSEDYVFYLDGNTLKFRGDVIYNPERFTGPQGSRGPQGNKGDTGEQGPPGEQGPEGVSGVVPDILFEVTTDNTFSNNPICNVTKNVIDGGNTHKYILNFLGLRGIPGKDATGVGKSAYELALQNGFEGTVQEWLASLKGIKGDKGDPGEKGEDGDTEFIKNLIEELEDEITLLRKSINSFINGLDNKIASKISQLVGKSDWWQQNFPKDIIGTQSNFGETDVKEYLQRIGLWYIDEDHTLEKWSSIELKIDGIRVEVNLIKESNNMSTDYESLAGELYTYLTGDTVTSGLQSTWSKFFRLGENNIQLLEWIAAGVETQANDREAIARLFASARNAENIYAGLVSRISEVEGNSYISENSLTTKVEESINTIILRSTDYSSLSSMASAIGDSTIAGVSTEVDRLLGIALTSLFAKGGAGRSAIVEEVSDLVSKLTLSVEGDEVDVLSLIELEVTKQMSSVTITADRIDLQGLTWADIINLSSEDLFSNNSIVINPSEILVVGTSTKLGYSTTIYSDAIDFYGSSTWGSNTSMIGFGGFNFPGLSYVTTHPVNGYGNLTITNGNIVAGENAKIKTPILTTDDNLLITSADNNGSITIQANDIYFTANNSIIASPSISSSDENLKNIISNIDVSIEDIALTRIVNYEFKKNPGKINVGTIAQDWKNIIPNAVKIVDNEQHLGLDYSSASIVSAVTAAREIVKLKQENEQLKQRLTVIEERLAQIQ